METTRLPLDGNDTQAKWRRGVCAYCVEHEWLAVVTFSYTVQQLWFWIIEIFDS